MTSTQEGEGGIPKADVVREVEGILYRKTAPDANKGQGVKRTKFGEQYWGRKYSFPWVA